MNKGILSKMIFFWFALAVLLNITPVYGEGIELSETSIRLKVGEHKTISLSINNDDVEWSSLDEEIACVEKGDISALKAGETDVIAAYQDADYTCHVVVEDNQQPEEKEPKTNEKSQDVDITKIKDVDDFCEKSAQLINDYDEGEVNGTYATKRLIVKTKKQIDISIYEPLEVIYDDHLNIYVIQFDTIKQTKAAYRDLKANRDVAWVECDQYIHVAQSTKMTTSTTSSHLSWGISAMGMDRYASMLSAKDLKNEVTVAVVDSGLNMHSDFDTQRIKDGYDFVEADDDPDDELHHGTLISSVIYECTPDLPVYILPIKVLDENGDGTVLNVVNGIRYAVAHGADIINLSFGGEHTSMLDKMVRDALDQNCIVVTAAGNENMDVSDSCPAHIEDCLTIGAVDQDLMRASYSNYGTLLDFVAPGEHIKGCVDIDEYGVNSGTSFAVPHIVGAVALIKLSDQNLSRTMIETKLKSCCIDLGNDGFDINHGYGMPDLSRLIVSIDPIITLPQVTYKKTYGSKAFLLKAQSTGDQPLTYQSSDKNILTVLKEGKVTLKKTYGKATITITSPASPSYNKLSKKVSVEIIPKKMIIRKIQSSKKQSIKITFKKDATISYYQLDYSYNSKFSKYKRIKVSKNKTSASMKVTSKKNVYVRIRSVSKKNGSHYGPWSAAKHMKAK